jgi:hypothetical protein
MDNSFRKEKGKRLKGERGKRKREVKIQEKRLIRIYRTWEGSRNATRRCGQLAFRSE